MGLADFSHQSIFSQLSFDPTLGKTLPHSLSRTSLSLFMSKTLTMKFRQRILAALASLPLILVTSQTATANSALESCASIQDPIRRFYCEGAILSGQAQQDLVNSYTPRQRQLTQAIGEVVYAFYEETGQPLPVTQETLQLMMEGLGANASEATFVYDRMVAHNNAIAAIIEADSTINRMNNFLTCLQTQGTGCIP